MSETPNGEHQSPIDPDAAEESDAPEVQPEDEEVVAADRLLGAFAIGVMALLLICIVLVLVASGNAPAGL
jgi:hypothetical protein